MSGSVWFLSVRRKKIEFKKYPAKKHKKKSKKKNKGKKDKLIKAADAGLAKGDDVIYEGDPHTIFKVSPDGTSLTLVDEDDELVRAGKVADVEKAEEENPTSSESDAGPSKGKPSTKSGKQDDLKDDPSDDDEPAQEDDDDDDDDWDD